MTQHHRHEWTHQPEGIETEQWACAECEAVSASCIVTDTRRGLHATGTALLICEGCLDYERRVVDDIADALGHWQHQPRSLVPAIRYDRDPSDGGGDGPRDGIAHPLDVIEVLWSWAEMFAEGTSRTLDDHDHAGEVIKGALMWAAHNPDASAWEDYRSEMRQLRHGARKVAGLLPQRQNGPCVHCGGQVVRDWADEHWQPRTGAEPEHRGLSDTLRCTGCGVTWGDRDWWMTMNRQSLRTLPQARPDHLLTLEDARRLVFPEVPAPTWRWWLMRDHERAEAGEPRMMPERGHDVRGLALYRVGDLAALVQRRADDTRPGRKAG